MRNQLLAVSLILAVGAALATQAARPDYPIQPVPLGAVHVTGGFWADRLETNRTVTIPHILAENESTGRVDNFRKGAGLMPGDYMGRRFNDTDIYKIVEAASYSLVAHPDPALEKQLDDLIALIGRSQQPDGYLFPARTVNPQKPAAGVGTERWQYENTGSHELYNSGHLYEAAVAHFQATGKRTLLDIALKNADLVVTTFGPNARKDAPGHEVVEMALVRLYRATGERRYLDEAKFFVDERGTDHHASQNYTEPSWLMYNDRAYRQDDKPVVDQTRAQGHAVRAVYLYSAMADIAALLKQPAYDTAIDRIWQDVVSKRMYLTGGLGLTGGTESFGEDYALPARSAYTETCASVGGILWYHRMFLKSGDAKYLDALEQTLYNGYLSGVSIKGDTFFYQNPLESTGRTQRSAYFDVACCPANLSRLMSQVPGLVYAQQGNTIYVNLYVNSEATITLPNGQVKIRQETKYPWEPMTRIAVDVDKPTEFTLKLRVPEWASQAPLAGDLYRFADSPPTRPRYAVMDLGFGEAPKGGWHDIHQVWRPNGFTRITLPLPVRRVLANAAVKDAAGKAAIQRGPIVYALEGADNDGKVLDLSLPLDAALTPTFRADLLGGVTALSAKVDRTAADGTTTTRTVTAIPYFAWANRGRGEMVVWVKQ